MEKRADQNLSPITDHEDSVDVQGLEDLFQWASDTVAEGQDLRGRRIREQRIRRQVLNIIHRSANLQAKAKHADELAYLHRRVIALQGALGERIDELGNLKQIVISQYHGLQRIPELEERIVQLEAQAKKHEEAEASRKHMANALEKLKKDNELLADLVSANEAENHRLVRLLDEARNEVSLLKKRRWWHLFFPTCGQ